MTANKEEARLDQAGWGFEEPGPVVDHGGGVGARCDFMQLEKLSPQVNITYIFHTG